MPYADDILQPHPPEVLIAKKEKFLAEFEEVFPGVIQKTREWMKAQLFRDYRDIDYGAARGCPLVSLSVINKVASFTGFSYNFLLEEYQQMIDTIAFVLWNEVTNITWSM